MTTETIPSPNAAMDGFWASKRRTEKITRIVVTIVLILGAITMMLPIIWMLRTSFLTRTDVFAVPPSGSTFYETLKFWIPIPSISRIIQRLGRFRVCTRVRIGIS